MRNLTRQICFVAWFWKIDLESRNKGEIGISHLGGKLRYAK